MTLGNPLARLRTVEIFGVLLPGLFMVASLGFSWVAGHSESATGLRKQIAEHFSSTPQWYPIALVVVSAWLLGSVVRAFPVWRLDTPLAKVFAVFVQKGASKPMKLLYEQDYPYPRMLAYDHEQLRKAGCISHANVGPIFEECHAHVAIDYCKEYAAMKSAAAAARIQEVEARTRMFYGMFWAMAIGIIMSASFSIATANILPLIWCALSFVLAVVFGQRLRFVRGHEARMIYYAYLIQRETELAASDSTSGPALPSNSRRCRRFAPPPRVNPEPLDGRAP